MNQLATGAATVTERFGTNAAIASLKPRAARNCVPVPLCTRFLYDTTLGHDDRIAGLERNVFFRVLTLDHILIVEREFHLIA
jgi:hypothetical protein